MLLEAILQRVDHAEPVVDEYRTCDEFPG
jgi:hypothetical protein